MDELVRVVHEHHEDEDLGGQERSEVDKELNRGRREDVGKVRVYGRVLQVRFPIDLPARSSTSEDKETVGTDTCGVDTELVPTRSRHLAAQRSRYPQRHTGRSR